jgi:hypothetical protein
MEEHWLKWRNRPAPCQQSFLLLSTCDPLGGERPSSLPQTPISALLSITGKVFPLLTWHFSLEHAGCWGGANAIGLHVVLSQSPAAAPGKAK